jgi:hypothetical protein
MIGSTLVFGGCRPAVRFSTMTTRDTTDTGRRRAPRQRSSPEPRGYAKARTAFEERAQDWLLERPARTMYLPENLHLFTALGVPCSTCGSLIYRGGDAGHTVGLTLQFPGSARDNRNPGRHWAAAITAFCRPAPG